MNISQAIDHLYPQANRDISAPGGPDVAVERGDDGRQRIIVWNEAKLGPRPTDQQLQDAWIPALKEQKIAEIRRRVVAEADAVMPVWEFIYITRARINDPRTATLETIAKKGRDMETYINHPQRTEAELQSVNWDEWA